MGQQHDMRIRHETRVDLGLFLVDIQAAREDLSRFEGFDESIFVHDGTAGGVDDDDAFLHLAEFCGGDDVSSVFLVANHISNASDESRVWSLR